MYAWQAINGLLLIWLVARCEELVLLFAGAMHIKLEDLTSQKWVITVLATAGVVASTLIVGGLTWIVLDLLKIPVSLTYCLLFGALISPTDPVAVRILTWGGLRGGISVAMALSIPPGPERTTIITITYVVLSLSY